MEALKEVKEWLLFKFQTVSSKPEESNVNRGMNPLTPQNIPEFIIPGSGNSSRRTSSECYTESFSYTVKRNSYSGRSPTQSPLLSPSESTPCFRTRGGSCGSAPVTPRHELRGMLGYSRDALSTPGLHRVQTNDDPLSFAAMSLPHFQRQTSYGFTTLTENPHTRRKESLFHVGTEGLLAKRLNTHGLKLRIGNYSDRSTPDISRLSMPNIVLTAPQARSMPSVVVTAAKQNSLTNSPENSSFPTQSSRRLSPVFHIYTSDGTNHITLPSSYNRFYNRRRSSLQIMAHTASELSSTSEEGTPTQDSPDKKQEKQRNSLTDLKPHLMHLSPKRHSAPIIQSGPTVTFEERHKQRSSSCHVILNDALRQCQQQQTHLFAPHGELKFSFKYLPASKQLKVTLIRAENLGGQAKQDRLYNCFAKMYLMPGKLQKQTSAVVKRSREPVFDQEFYFQVKW